MKKQIFYIQVWIGHDAIIRVWDDVTATCHESEHPGEIAQAIADATHCSVRMTYPMTGVKIGSLNGHYFRPSMDHKIYSPNEVCPDLTQTV